jgi:stage V sporulation protein D (sporulation-specific penicillin-binding protein)
LQRAGKPERLRNYINGAYAPGVYVASFYGFARKTTSASVLVIVDEPGGALTTGSSVASPVGAEILQNCLEYLNSTSYSSTDVSSASSSTVPDVRGKTVSEAKSVLDTLGIPYSIIGSADGIVTDQDQMKVTYSNGMTITLTVSSASGDAVLMPNLNGMSLQNVNEILSALD